ncbi:unnamed protein product [Prorocentrum cordatum]|uniref:Uncharacterized protein n=1 Tax=Prorocentrum cordatum TaxID=2364126 RepID=A0ABN9SY49_9DINO|nr:unnamed protein product [Polarella glacialis]
MGRWRRGAGARADRRNNDQRRGKVNTQGRVEASLSGTWRRRARRNSGTGAAAPTPHPRLKRWRDRAAATRCRAGLWHGAGSAATEAAAGRSGARRSGLHGPRGRGLLSSSRP